MGGDVPAVAAGGGPGSVVHPETVKGCGERALRQDVCVRSAEFRAATLRVVARAAELRATFAAEVQARRDAAVSVRLVSGDTEGLLSALPVAARRGHRRRVGRWLPDGASTRFAGRVLLDAQARPLLHERVHDGYVLALWRYDGDRTEEVRNHGLPEVTWVLHSVGAVGVDDMDRWVQRWTWRNERVVRVDHARAAPRGWASASATQAELDAAGEVRALRDGVEPGEYREDNRLDEDEWLDALDAALERAALIPCDRRNWIAARDAAASRRHCGPRQPARRRDRRRAQRHCGGRRAAGSVLHAGQRRRRRKLAAAAAGVAW
jgi:hypothetical protein